MLCASPANAQRNGGSGSLPAARPSGHSGQLNGAQHRGPVGARLVRLHRGQRAFANSAYGPNYYPYYDSPFGDFYADAPPPQIILETSAPVAPPAPQAYPGRPPEALVMELRGDHWVRLTSYGAQEPNTPGTAAAATTSSSTPATAATVAAAHTAPLVELPPAILIFRDGHREESANYTIVGARLTMKTDYWTTGTWTRTVALADLDLPATLRLNRDRSTRFSLPSRPGEVMMRP